MNANIKALKKVFSERVEALRKERRISRKDLAEMVVGGSLSTYEKWVSLNEDNETKLPSVLKASRICDRFEISLDYLFGRSDHISDLHKEISDYTGLSDAAISMLHMLHDQSNPQRETNKQSIDMLNQMLETPFTRYRRKGKDVIVTLFTYLYRYIHTDGYVMDMIDPEALRTKLADRDGYSDWELCETTQTNKVQLYDKLCETTQTNKAHLYDKQSPETLSVFLNVSDLLPQYFRNLFFSVVDEEYRK